MKGACLNALKVTGSHDSLKEYWKEIFYYPTDSIGHCDRNSERMFCFNALVPVPEKLIYEGVAARREWYRTHWGFATFGGYKDGEYFVRWNDEHTELLMAFETSGLPPLAWVKNASDLFPDLMFTICFEGTFPIYGQASFSNGELNCYSCADYKSVKHWFEPFCSIDGFPFGKNELVNERLANEWMIAAIESELSGQAIDFASSANKGGFNDGKGSL